MRALETRRPRPAATACTDRCGCAPSPESASLMSRSYMRRCAPVPLSRPPVVRVLAVCHSLSDRGALVRGRCRRSTLATSMMATTKAWAPPAAVVADVAVIWRCWCFPGELGVDQVQDARRLASPCMVMVGAPGVAGAWARLPQFQIVHIAARLLGRIQGRRRSLLWIVDGDVVGIVERARCTQCRNVASWKFPLGEAVPPISFEKWSARILVITVPPARDR